MKLKLKVIGGKHAGQEISVPPGRPFLFGRGEDCQLRAGSELVSRHHCVLSVDELAVYVRDLGSKNGTFINGERISGEQEVADGDELTVGPLKFTLVCTSSAPVSVNVATGKLAARPGEVDVSEWLSDDTDQAAALTQTQCMRSSDTQAIESGAPRQTAAEEAPAQQPDANANKTTPQARPKSGVIGKLPPIPAPITADSRDAATQMLQKLRRKI